MRSNTQGKKKHKRKTKNSKDEQLNLHKSVEYISVNANAIFLSKNDLKFLRQY